MKYFKLKNSMLGGFLALFLSVAVTGTALANSGFIRLSNYFAEPNSQVKVSGENFGANQNLNVSMDGQNQNVETSASGSFNEVKFNVPFSSQNSKLEIKAEGGGQTAKAFLSVGGYYPNVTPSAWYVVRGGSVNFSGQGFAPNETIKVKANGEDRGEVESNSSGSFASPEYALPYQGGPVKFTFSGQLSKAVSSRTITMASNQPHIVLSTYYAPGGSKVVVTGHDFGSGEAVNINFEGLNFGSPIADSLGKFTYEITIPSSSGKKNIQAQGLTTNLKANAVFTISTF